MTNHLFDSLLSASDADNSALFAYLPDGDVLSYGDVWESCISFSHCLLNFSLSCDDRVIIQLEKSMESVFLYLSCLRCGFIYIPLNPAYTESEIIHFLDDASPQLFICESSRYDSLLPLCESRDIRLISLDNFLSCIPTFSSPLAVAYRTGSDIASIIYTSGTTGRSKGAMLSHSNLLSNASTLVDLWRFTSSDVLLHALPIFHVHGLFIAFHIVFLCKCSIRFLPKFSVSSVLEHLPMSTAMMGVPTFYTRLLCDDRFTATVVDGIRIFISGSAPLSSEAHKLFFTRTGHSILERYGMSETGMLTSNPYDGERRAGSVGFPLPDVQLRICSYDTGIEVAQGEVGVIEVKGPNVFSGYWNLPSYNDTEFRPDGYFITGDLARMDKSGVIEIVGRQKDLIISGGMNIYPKEIESALESYTEGLECAVVGLPHCDFGEAVVAFVCFRESGADTLTDSSDLESELLSHCETCLASFKCPKRILILPSLPRNSMGKIEKNRLRQDYEALFTID